jgi:hypothetical protein
VVRERRSITAGIGKNHGSSGARRWTRSGASAGTTRPTGPVRNGGLSLFQRHGVDFLCLAQIMTVFPVKQRNAVLNIKKVESQRILGSGPHRTNEQSIELIKMPSILTPFVIK